jgi:hypothetical protein
VFFLYYSKSLAAKDPPRVSWLGTCGFPQGSIRVEGSQGRGQKAKESRLSTTVLIRLHCGIGREILDANRVTCTVIDRLLREQALEYQPVNNHGWYL